MRASLVLGACILLLPLARAQDAPPLSTELTQTYQSLLEQVHVSEIRRDYTDVQACGSRIAGSSGEQKAFALFEQEAAQLGASSVTRENFNVSVPDPDAKGLLKVGSSQATLYPLWPNLVRTSTCHVSGPLVYGGDGTLESLSRHKIQGAIVVIEFNSGTNWRNPAKLGAQAVVLLEPHSMPRGEAESKFTNIPLDVPRFYLLRRDAGPILTAAFAGQSASVDCNQSWQSRTSSNVIATFRGTNPALDGGPVAFSAPADSMSIVPALAPGMESAGSISALLELCRIYGRSSHPRTFQAILSGSHCLALRGAREYVENRIEYGGAPLLSVSLDLSSGSGVVGSFGRGWFYDFRDESEWPVQDISRNMHDHADHLAKLEGLDDTRDIFVDAVNNGDNRDWRNDVPGRFAADCEPLILSGMDAVTLRTVDDGRVQVDTPFDTIDHVDLSNIQQQIQTVAVLGLHLLWDPVNKGGTQVNRLPLEFNAPQTMSLTGGFASLAGQVVTYDPARSFVPDNPVPDSLAVVMAHYTTFAGVRGDMIQAVSDPDARYRFDGVAPGSAFAWDHQYITEIDAFHIDPASGSIDYAPTFSLPGFEAYDTEFMFTTSYRESPIVVFHSVAVDLYDIVDPQSLTALRRTRVLDPATGSGPINFGVVSQTFEQQRMNPDAEDTEVIFLLPGQRYQLLAGDRTEMDRMILTGSTIKDESGNGYVAPDLEQNKQIGTPLKVFQNPALHSAQDIFTLNQARIAKFRKYRILGPDIQTLQGQAQRELTAASQAEVSMDWSNLYRHSRAAWGYALRAHPIVMSTANDVVNGVVFYLFLLIPFSYFLERITFGHQLMSKQLIWSVIYFIVSFVFLRIIHPAFEIVSNPSMIFIAFVMGALSLIVMTFIIGKFNDSMRTVRAKQSGLHEVDIRRSSVAAAAFNLGVSNLRRRKARTVLTTLTLTVMTFIVLSFTSIVNKLRLDETPSGNQATYAGILMRQPGLDPLQLATYRQVLNEFAGRASVARRAYFYGADPDNPSIVTIHRGQSHADIHSVLGLDPEESAATHPQDALSAGRWFKPGERNVVILPDSLAQGLRIDRNDVGTAKISFGGNDFTVIGLVNDGALREIKDLDGDNIEPADFSLSKDYQQQKASSNQAFRNFVRFDPGSVILIPASTALFMGADLRSMAVTFPKPDETEKALQSLMPRLRLNLYAGIPASPGSPNLIVRQFSVQEAGESGGLILVVIQLLIAGIFVLNTMVASVYERTREIAIFSSIGLAPNHISILFFAESLVYGTLGSVIGYFAAQTLAKFIVATNTLQGLTLNFSSGSAVMSAGFVMVVVIGSTIYPAKLAAKIAAPAVNEEAFQTQPDGDVWELPLPFSVGAAEAGPIAQFLLDWFKAYEGYTIGDFVSANPRLTVVQANLGEEFHLHAGTWLAPYDLGISQEMVLSLVPSPVPGIYHLDLKLKRLSGDPENWPVVNQRFLASIRKEFLTWRSLKGKAA